MANMSVCEKTLMFTKAYVRIMSNFVYRFHLLLYAQCFYQFSESTFFGERHIFEKMLGLPKDFSCSLKLKANFVLSFVDSLNWIVDTQCCSLFFEMRYFLCYFYHLFKI